MSLLRSKPAQLSDYLRASIAQGQLNEPLPGMRLWSRQLGVSRRTLGAAIKQLHREGLLTVGTRGVKLRPVSGATSAVTRDRSARIVRVLLYGPDQPQIEHYMTVFGALNERLLLHDAELKWEKCTPPRLREIARQPMRANELLVLASVPPAYQRLFANSAHAVAVLGEVAPGLSLPFVAADQAGAVRHAIFKLLRRGFAHVSLIYADIEAPGTKRMLSAFHDACKGWRPRAVTAEAISADLESPSLFADVRAFAESVRGRCGVVVAAPVPIGLVATGLLQHGVAIPAQAELAAIFHTSDAVRLFPRPIYYPLPTARLAKHLSEVASRFFDTGRLSAARHLIVSEPEKGGMSGLAPK